MEEKEHETILKECAEYFRKNKSFDRVFVLIRQKMESFGKVSGTVVMNGISEDERSALEGFFGNSFIGDSISVKLKDFEKALAATRFEGITLRELLEEYFNESIISNKDKKQKTNELKNYIRMYIENRFTLQFGENNQFSIVLRNMSDSEFNKLVQTCSGNAYVPNNENREQIIKAVLEMTEPIGKAFEKLAALGNSTVRLSVLAMDCAGDPHAFDRDRTEGKLFIKALHSMNKAACFESKNSLSAEEILELYISYGIRPDDISSFTVLHGIRLFNGEKSHAAYDSFIENHEFYLVSLSNLRYVKRAVPVNRDVFVVENQMVFSQLCEACPKASIICTSGQMKTASLLVIDLLCREDCRIYYSGDFDGEGLSIANRLIKRNSEKIKLWHMDTESYKKSVSSVELNEERLKKVRKIDNSELSATVNLILDIKKAGYQEKLIDTLISDINHESAIGEEIG